MIDTHAHIYASEFDNDREQVVQRALAQGIESYFTAQYRPRFHRTYARDRTSIPRGLPFNDGTSPLLC